MNPIAVSADTRPTWSSARSPLTDASGVLAQLTQTLGRWMTWSRSRDTLADLDDHLLRDIGLTRREARAEASKHFWQP